MKPKAKTRQSLKPSRLRYTCAGCGERFLSLLELRAHRKKYKGPHRRPKAQKTAGPDIVAGIENLRDQEYRGYREADRSS
jgi:hypothetical protein